MWWYEFKEWMKDLIPDWIRYKYYDLVPYEYRPRQIWYVFKCWDWNRYTTVKPRYLGHTWTDRDNLLLHMSFEILSNYVEFTYYINFILFTPVIYMIYDMTGVA